MIRQRMLILLAVLASGALHAEASSNTLNLDEYRGQVVVVDFWASWCVPCRRSFPWLDALQKQYADQGLIVIGVNLDSDAGDADAFLSDYPVDFHIIRDPAGKLAREFSVEAMPTSYVIGRDGSIVARHMGFQVKKQDEYEEIIRAAIAAETS